MPTPSSFRKGMYHFNITSDPVPAILVNIHVPSSTTANMNVGTFVCFHADGRTSVESGSIIPSSVTVQTNRTFYFIEEP